MGRVLGIVGKRGSDRHVQSSHPKLTGQGISRIATQVNGCDAGTSHVENDQSLRLDNRPPSTTNLTKTELTAKYNSSQLGVI
jgi:hypothetical protein